MNVLPGEWRRWAVKLAQHAAWVLSGAQSSWADAMRRELDYIEDDRAALRWAVGCVMASYMARLAALTRLRWRVSSRPVVASILLLFLALAVQGHASGEASLPVFEETTCDLPDVTPDIRPRLRCGTVRGPRDHARPDTGSFSLALLAIKTPPQPSPPHP